MHDEGTIMELVVQYICIELVGPTLLFPNINFVDVSLIRGVTY